MTLPPDWSVFSTEEEALFGLAEGDLDPLLRHIRSGGNVTQEIADRVADMIEGGGRFVLKATARPGRPASRAALLRKMNIGLFVVNRLEKGGWDSAVKSAQLRFQCSKSTVEAAVAFMRKHRAELPDWWDDGLDEVEIARYYDSDL